ncbi:MAG TPA: hypothetical protein DCS93_44350 [Microscillaceae bacterium]|nr:hypothetical protein [Microscillaceae bacterium]
MRILHINTSDNGGAGKAVVRLMNGLLKNQLENDLLVLYKYQNHPHIHRFVPNTSSTFKRLKFSLKYRLLQYKQKRALSGKNHNLEIFSFPESLYDIQQHPLFHQADIIHLHWVAGFLDYPSFFKKIKKPVVWTLHDSNPFIGGFHYQSFEEKEEFLPLTDLVKSQKRKGLAGFENLHIVTLSRWLYEASSKSSLFAKYKHALIPNGLDTDLFKPYPKKESRELLGLPQDKKIILFAAESIENEMKGLSFLLEALQKLKNQDFMLATLGTGALTSLGFPYKALGFIDDPQKVAKVYSAADIFVIPALEDNLPNTALESIACGTPVVGFNDGGIPDMIRPGENGLLAEPKNCDDLAEKIHRMLNDETLVNTMGVKAREIALNEYDASIQAHSYIKLYEQILATT